MAKWTPEEDNQLKEFILQELTTEEIAGRMNRTFKSIQHRRASVGRGLKTTYSDDSPTKLKPKEMNKLIINILKEELAKAKPYKAVPLHIVGKGDTLVIHLTDLHAGKIVRDENGKIIFDEHIFKQRINRLCEQILKLLDNHIKGGVPITNAVILATGDNANGEDIYATQAYEQELAPPKQVMLVVEVMTKLMLALLNRGLPVSFYGAKGNHGRISKEANPTDNWDIMIYMILDYWSRYILKNPNLKIVYSEADYLTLDIRGHKYMIRHIAPEQPDTPSGRVKFNEWARMYKAAGIVYGHWHHFGVFDVDGVRVFRGGSIVGGDALSESMAKHSEPIQCIWGVNEDRPSTFFYSVDLNEKKSRAER